MDFAKLDTSTKAEAGAPMTVIGPDGIVTDLVIFFRGEDSEQYQQITHEISLRDKKVYKNDFEKKKEFEARIAEVITLLATGWENAERDGKKIKFSYKELSSLFKQAPYILFQASGFVKNRTNFLAKA